MTRVEARKLKRARASGATQATRISRRNALKSTIAFALYPAFGRRAYSRMGRGGVQTVKRPLGLQGAVPPAYYTSKPFLNLVKTGGWSQAAVAPLNYRSCPWNTSNGSGRTSEEQYVQLDSNGYGTSLTAANIGNGAPGAQSFTFLQMYLCLNETSPLAPGQTFFYPPGVYRLKYVGQGTVKVVGDGAVTLTNAAVNTYTSGTFTVATPTTSPGLTLEVTAIGGLNAATFTGSISGTTLSIPGAVTGTIGVGMALTGTNVVAGTVIVQQLTTTTWQVSISQTVASTAMALQDHPRDISVVENQYAAAYDAGAQFHPNYSGIYTDAKISCFRGMQWANQDNIQWGHNIAAGIPAGATSATLPFVWPFLSGTYTCWFYGGQSTQAILTFNSTTIQFVTPPANAVASSPNANVMILVPPSTWATRTPTTYVSYAMAPSGVPYETIVDFANAIGADVWLNTPIDAPDDYVTNLGLMADGRLAAGRKFYVEPSNEVWNQFSYNQGIIAQMFGCAQWPAQPNDVHQAQNWYGMRCAVISELLALAIGSSKVPSRCIPVIGMQGGVSSTLTNAMNTTYWTSPIDGYSGPASAHKISGVAANYYFPDFYGGPHVTSGGKFFSVADATTMVGVAAPLDDFFAVMHGNVGTVANGSHVYSSLSYVGFGGLTYSGWIDNEYSDAQTNIQAAATYGLNVLVYEGGPNFFPTDQVSGAPNGTTVPGWGALVTAALRDPRMYQASLDHLHWWNTNGGGGILNYFADAFSATAATGAWGAVENYMQTRSLANTPRWAAMKDYVGGA